MTWLADDLATKVRLKCRIPDGSSIVSDTEIFSLADDEIAALITPLLREGRGEYGVTSTDYTVDGTTDEFRIPTRSIVGGIRDVVLVDSADGTGASLPRVSLETRDVYKNSASVYWPNGAAWTVQGDHVIVLPSDTGAQSWTLRVRYYRRPSRLVAESDANKIDGVGSAPTYSTESGGGTLDGDTVDVIEGNPNFDWLATDLTANVSGTDVTLSSTVTEAAVGDYISRAGTSPVVQVPPELHPLLVTAVCVKVHESLGNRQRKEDALKTLDREIGNARKMLHRIEGEEIRIFNRSSPMRSGSRWR